VDGQSIDVTVWETRNSAMPGLTSISKYDAEGRMIYEEAAAPFGTIVTRLTTRADAIAAAGGPAPEMMVSLFVEPSKPIDRPRETTRATMRIRVKDGDLPEIPSAGAQRVERSEDGESATLKVNIHDNVPATDAQKNDKAYLEPSAMADGSDELIRKMAKRAAADAGDDPMKRAEAMRAYVYEHISSKALDTAFATASEVARMKRGDCSEHGVLLCAMLRADGIPARVATGLVYADAFAGASDIFGWHMWTQALIDGKWVDLDATLPRRYDAAHVLFGTSSLDDAGSMNQDLASIMTLMGNLEIEIIDVGYETK
jgi:transglutaminase-like putative cysteine protease